MIDKGSPNIRELVAESRSHAILGRQEQSLARLDNVLAELSAAAVIDRLVLLMAKAEILHLDCRDGEALEILTTQIDTLVANVPEKMAVAIAYNRSDVALAIFQPHDFSEIVDRSRIAEVELWDYRSFYDASEAAKAGKHYESLPLAWRELLRTYHQGCWRPQRAASRLMTMECLALGWFDQAVFHAIMSGQKEVAQQVGNSLVAFGTVEALELVVDKVLECAHLQRHALIALEFLDRIADAVPEGKMNDVLNWMLPHAESNSTNEGQRVSFERAWQTLATISPRLNRDQAKRVIDAATSHRAWNAPIEAKRRVLTVRDSMMKAVNWCVDKLPQDSIDALVEKCLPLALERRQDHDYADAINLLCHLGHCGGERTKARLRERLYPPGQPINSILLQVAEHLGQELTRPDSLAKEAERVAQCVRLQVQRVPKGKEVQKIASYGCLTINLEGETLYVYVADAVQVEAVFRHRKKLSDESLQLLIDAILAMVEEKENLLSNKIALIQSLQDVGDVCSEQSALRIFEVLSPLAGGDVTEPSHTMSAAEADNPLNPFKMHTGKPTDLRAVALYTLACIERDKPGVYGKQLDGLLEFALSDLDPTVRTLAFAAAREKPTLSDSEFTALILGTRDMNPDAGHAAFAAIANKAGLKLKRPQWRLLIHSAKLAAQSHAVKLRQAAAHAIAKLVDQAPDESVKKPLYELRELFHRDTCHSVRGAAQLSE